MFLIAWLVPLLVLLYVIFVFWYSNKMVKTFKTSYAFLVVIGILFPPIWILLAIVSLAINIPKEKNSSKRK